MKPWDVYTWTFPDAGAHPAVIVGTDERLRLKDTVNVLLCSSHRSRRAPEAHEVLLNGADGLDWETLCKCDLLYAVDKRQLTQRRGSVSTARRRAIGERLIRALGLAGL
jgi:mRNA-degrading endonuclease toxin of MazEF toxin-antitoxin module